MFRKVIILLLIMIGVSDAKLATSKQVTEDANTARLMKRAFAEIEKIEQGSWVPYKPHLVLILRKQDKKPVLSGVIPLMFERKAHGRWKLLGSAEASEWQRVLSKDPLGGCPVVENTLDENIGFKPKPEFFLRRITKPLSNNIIIEAGSQKEEGILKNGCMDFSKSCARFATLEGVKFIILYGIESKPIHLPLAPDFKPYILIRFTNGEILPVPARLDTVIYDDDHQRLHLTYRATVLMGPSIRKMEYRLVGPESWVKASAQESDEQALARHRAMRVYLERCPPPPPGWAGEPCADPQGPIDIPSLSQALGLKRVQ